ncbi:MAG TPA: response regulator [Aliidongia sp.]|uniref:response regulator n=1 Tax=Aliidongia sp. TaxID=1914230 RepID=UPI002DDCBE0E|nr:response regulator [Aliidongia sp.]HEV2675716.1 response regulator [Aliidongia sp.]
MIGRGKTALIVDPTEMVRQMIQAALRELRFERVVSVESAEDAEHALASTTIDLALIDWQLGARSGFDLAADIRTGRVPPRRDLPIVIMTWKAEPRSVLAAQGLKLNGLLIKPLSRDALEKKVTAALTPSPPPIPMPPKAAPKRFLGQTL